MTALATTTVMTMMMMMMIVIITAVDAHRIQSHAKSKESSASTSWSSRRESVEREYVRHGTGGHAATEEKQDSPLL